MAAQGTGKSRLIRAALATAANQPMEIVELELAPPKPGEVLVRIEAAGVCASDVGDWRDKDMYFPVVLGHEAAGVVEEVPAGSRFNPGDRVVLNWMPACGHCDSCARGLRNSCDTVVAAFGTGTQFDGTSRLSRDGQIVHQLAFMSAYATHSVVPEMCCIPLAEGVPFDVAALVGCAIPTGAGAAWNAVKVAAGDCVVIYGMGGVGLSALLGAKCAGATHIIAVDVLDKRLAKPRQLGATDTVLWQGDAESTAALVREVSGGRGVDYAFEVTGNPDATTSAIMSCRPGGTAVLLGLAKPDAVARVYPRAIMRNNLKIVGSWYGSCDPQREFPRLLNLYMDGRLPIDELISHRMPLEGVNEAFQLLMAGESIRTVLMIGEQASPLGD